MKRVALMTTLVLATLAGVYALWQLRGAVLIFILSLSIAAAARTVVEFLQQWRVPWWLALLATYLAIIGLVVGTGVLVGPAFTADLRQLSHDFVAAYQAWLRDWSQGGELQRSVVRQLPEPKQLLTSLGGDFSALLQPLLGATLSFFGLVGTLVIAIVVSIYWSIGREYFERFWLSLLPVDIRGEGRTIWREIAADLGGYLRSEFVQGYSAAVLLGLAYWLLGQPYPVLLAVVGGLAWLLPWVGLLIAVLAVSLASLPALLFDVGAEGLLSLAGAVLATIGVLVFLELLLEPRLYHRRRFNPLLEVLVVVASFSALGVGGLLLGPPLAAAIQVCASHLLYPRSPKPVTPPPPSVLKRRLESLKATVATLEHPPPEYQSLISRLEILLDEAEPILQVLPPDREPTAQIV